MMKLHTSMLILSMFVLLSGVEGRIGKLGSALFGELQDQLDTIEDDVKSIKIALKVGGAGKDCADLYKNGVKQSGVYTIQPRDGVGKMKVYCDMVTDGGGWTVFQSRQDGSVNFFRGWADYKAGFGSLRREFWLGNDNIHLLTRRAAYKLRVDLEDFENKKVYAVYNTFSLGSEKENYRLKIGSYSGNAGDSLRFHNGQPFSTKDRDNGCATRYKGAWWYNSCLHSNLNGLYHHGKHKSYADGVNWDHYKGLYYSLKRTSMKIRPVGFKSSK